MIEQDNFKTEQDVISYIMGKEYGSLYVKYLNSIKRVDRALQTKIYINVFSEKENSYFVSTYTIFEKI